MDNYVHIHVIYKEGNIFHCAICQYPNIISGTYKVVDAKCMVMMVVNLKHWRNRNMNSLTKAFVCR